MLLRWRLVILGGVAFGLPAACAISVAGATPSEQFFATAVEIQAITFAVLVLQRRVFFPRMPDDQEQWATWAMTMLLACIGMSLLGLAGVEALSAVIGSVVGLIGGALGVMAVVLEQLHDDEDRAAQRLTPLGTLWFPSLRAFIASDGRRALLPHRWRAFAWEETPTGTVLTFRLAWNRRTREAYAVQRIDSPRARGAWGPVEVLGRCGDRRAARRLLGARGSNEWRSLHDVRRSALRGHPPRWLPSTPPSLP